MEGGLAATNTPVSHIRFLFLCYQHVIDPVMHVINS